MHLIQFLFESAAVLYSAKNWESPTAMLQGYLEESSKLKGIWVCTHAKKGETSHFTFFLEQEEDKI